MRQNVYLVLASLFVSMLAAEVALRIFGLGFPIEPDRELDHVHPVNYSYVGFSGTGDYSNFDVTFDEFGFRVCPSSSRAKTSIIMLGDSFVEAVQVPCEKSFVALVDSQVAASGLSVRNLGVSSYSPLLSRLQFERLPDDFEPRACVHMLFSNDSTDDERYASHGVRGASGEIIAVDNPESSSTWRKYLRSSYLVRLVNRAVILARESLWPTQSTYVRAADGTYEDNNSLSDLTVREIRALERHCRERKSPYLLTCVPAEPKHGVQVPRRYCREARKMAQANGIRFLDLDAEFARHPNAKKFFDSDIHFTEAGHAIVADAIVSELRAMGVISSYEHSH
jgi:hypothetical protein